MSKSFRFVTAGFVLSLIAAACSATPTRSPNNDTSGSGGGGVDSGTDSNTGGNGSTGGTVGSGGSGGTGGGATGGPGGSGGTGGIVVTGDFTVEVATWKGNAKGAYTIIHDDLCGSPTSVTDGTVADLLNAQGLKAAFGAIAGACGESWASIQSIKASGHEIINHSWSHACLADTSNCPAEAPPTTDYAQEIDAARTEIETNVPSQVVSFFIFPYDSYDETVLNHLRNAGYLGARGGTKGLVNSADYPDDFKLNFDVYGPGYSAYCDEGACATEGGNCCGVDPLATPCTPQENWSTACRGDILDAYVDDAIAQGGWAIREVHGVGDGWEGVPTDVYTAHLTYIKSKVTAGDLWVDVPTEIIKYRRARDYCAPTVTDSTASFGTPSSDCTKYLTPLTLIIKPTDGSDPASLTATQGATPLTVTKIGMGTFQIDGVDPSSGDILLAKQ